MKTNTAVKSPSVTTHEGGRAVAHQKPLQELERTVASCLLGEDTFYESGGSVKDRIFSLAQNESPEAVSQVAIKARNKWRLRHAPLQLVLAMINTKQPKVVGLVAKTIFEVVQRPDEMGELLAMYWKDGKKPLPSAMKKGLAKAFTKFDAYQLGKWNKDAAIKLRDVLFMVHAKPNDEQQAATWKQLVDKTLPTPDTWEVALSAGADKKETFERLITTKKMPYMALLKNLRNMVDAKVDHSIIKGALINGAEKSKALPFRYLSALRHAPSLAVEIEEAMLLSIKGNGVKLPGRTLIVVDVSGSMDYPLSDKSEVNRIAAASALAIMAREVCEECRVFTFSTGLVEVPAFRGLGLVKGISDSQMHGGTDLHNSLRQLQGHAGVQPNDRVVVITDEQSSSGAMCPWPKGYVLNLASYKPTLALNQGWTRINGLSEQFIEWVTVEEGLDQ